MTTRFAPPDAWSYRGGYPGCHETLRMKRLLTSIAVFVFLMGAFLAEAQAASLRFRNSSNASVYLYLTSGKLYNRGICVAPHSSITEPLQDQPVAIDARFYRHASGGPNCNGPAEYHSDYGDVWRTGIEFWAVGNDEESYRFYHN